MKDLITTEAQLYSSITNNETRNKFIAVISAFYEENITLSQLFEQVNNNYHYYYYYYYYYYFTILIIAIIKT